MAEARKIYDQTFDLFADSGVPLCFINCFIDASALVADPPVNKLNESEDGIGTAVTTENPELLQYA